MIIVQHGYTDIFSWPAAWITVVGGEPLRNRNVRREIDQPLSSVGSNFLTEATVGHVLFNAPRGARLVGVQPQIPPLSQRLIDNYTEIIENVVDTFTCNGRVSCVPLVFVWHCLRPMNYAICQYGPVMY